MGDKPQRSWQARPEFNERRYRRVDTRVWNDARVRGFSPNGRLVWVLLLTAPSTTAIPGVLHMGVAGLAEIARMDRPAFDQGLAECVAAGLVVVDSSACVVWVPDAFLFNSPQSPNVIRSWRAEVSLLAESDLLSAVTAAIRDRALVLGPSFARAADELFGDAPRLTRGRGASNGLSPALRFAVLERDGFRCRYCGATPDRVLLEIDHVVPHVSGGPDTLENLRTACGACNGGKGSKRLQVVP